MRCFRSYFIMKPPDLFDEPYNLNYNSGSMNRK